MFAASSRRSTSARTASAVGGSSASAIAPRIASRLARLTAVSSPAVDPDRHEQDHVGRLRVVYQPVGHRVQHALCDAELRGAPRDLPQLALALDRRLVDDDRDRAHHDSR